MTVLAYRALGLGDFLTGVPAYRALRRHHRGRSIVLAAPAPLAPLLPLAVTGVRLEPTAPLQPPRRLPAHLDVAVNLHGRGPESHRLLAGLGTTTVQGFRCDELGLDGPEWRADEHEVRRWVRMLAWFGVEADPADLMLARPETASPAPGSVVVHPGAAEPSRRWPAERFAAVAAALQRDGHRVVVTGVSAERRLAVRVARLAGLPAERVLAGRLRLDALAALVASARLVVCGDTGVAHLATAYQTSSVLVFGPTPPSHWGPPDKPCHKVLWRPERTASGSPAGHVEAVSTSDVLAESRDLLGARRSA